ncbi:MAG: EpsG family protein [Oscillospiraceae bacterium]|nr:EpsG family protein [Oscillospiraceae bacterium]
MSLSREAAMGHTPYILMVAAVLLFGAIMPQKGPKRIRYIILMTVLHTCLCGFRYQLITGDLHKYYWIFRDSGTYGWFSAELWAEGRNFGFFYFNKLIYLLSDGDFQVFLFVIAAIVHIALGYVIHRYSPAPWFSYLVWNCMAFYIFGFNAIKQALAMAFVMLAFVGIAEKRLRLYLVMMALAGAIHMPALVFLPAYWLAQMRVRPHTLALYLIAGIALYVFRNEFVAFIRTFYYEDDEIMIHSGEIGSRMIMILGFALFGLLFRGFRDSVVDDLFHIMAVASILQLLAGFDNIFTRLTDYYFQMSVLYLPMVFFPRDGILLRQDGMGAVFPFNRRSAAFLAVFVAVFVLWFYWTYNINITIEYEVDNYLNYRSMWDVIP